MTRIITAAAAAAMLTAAFTTPIFAQAAVQEPGAFAFYHPNADVLNGRSGYRPLDANAYYGAYAYSNEAVPAPQVRHHRAVRRAR